MVSQKLINEFQQVEAPYHRKFGDGYLALIDPLHPNEKNYRDGIKAMKLAIKNNVPLPTMTGGTIY